jgi:hypothetical protein
MRAAYFTTVGRGRKMTAALSTKAEEVIEELPIPCCTVQLQPEGAP